MRRTMDKVALKQFIFEAHQKSYSDSACTRRKEKDGSSTTIYERGNWKSHSNNFGESSSGERQVVFYKDKPVWIKTSYSKIIGEYECEEDIDLTYFILGQAKKHNTHDTPYCGPKEYKFDDTFTYLSEFIGNVEEFKGEEIIKNKDKIIYKATHIGGFVDIG